MSFASHEPNTPDLLHRLHQAADFQRRGELRLARKIYEEILRTNPGQFEALHLLGVLEFMSGKFTEGLDLVSRAISINPMDATVYRNRSIAWRQLGRLEESLADVKAALALDDRQPALHCDQGFLLNQLRRPEHALASFQTAIDQNPALPEAYLGSGNALCELGRWREAAASFERAIALRTNFTDALANCAVAFNELEDYSRAIDCWTRALVLDPGNQGLRAQLCFARRRTCAWQDLDSEIARLLAGVARGEAVCDPFQMVVLTDSVSLHRMAAELWVRARCPADASLGRIAPRERRERIRIGYFSADFHDHATSRLLAGVLERHDRAKFEVVGFSFGPDSKDPVRQRIRAACDAFLDVRTLADREVAQHARNMGIDIAVDLKGHTRGSRGGIFALRAAPVQVSYLGFPGTSGASYMDYLLADSTVVPEHLQSGYTERIIFLPGSYQANDGRLEISDRRFSRRELGLPDQGFVFCCFNNVFKITPAVFAIWIRILQRVPGSVLWLLQDNPFATANLRREATARGVDEQRLVFAERMTLPLHLARHAAADLFLDTMPYGAHTTASDALWAGLPVLTRTGESFASRVAASLLTTLELPELIAQDAQTFEDTAVCLATNPVRLDLLRKRLWQSRRATPVFDSGVFARQLEAAFRTVYELHQQGLPPASVFIPRASAPSIGQA
jgi:predicted O-linked N-acetylglucosamine transferase (SPINDLY family)